MTISTFNRHSSQSLSAWLPVLLFRVCSALAVLAGLYLAFMLYAGDKPLFALLWLLIMTAVVVVYWHPRLSTMRYLFPALLTVLLFVVLPIVLTAAIGFSNYSGRHLIDQQRAFDIIMATTIESDVERLDFVLISEQQNSYRIVLSNSDGKHFVTRPFTLTADSDDQTITLSATEFDHSYQPLPLREVSRNRKLLSQLVIKTATGHRYRMTGFRQFAALVPQYQALSFNSIKDLHSNVIYQANPETGFYQNEQGQFLTPGYYVNVGFKNYVRTLTDPSISEPFWAIFIWTVAFAGLSVLFTLFLGLTLACLISMKDLHGRSVYRVLLILPYAVPAFISILVFKGLFNQSFGEINMILQALFGISPQWFDNPWLARLMVLLVNTWLGYPYIMILSLGMLKTIPADLYEAAAIAGSGILAGFFNITLPLVLTPLMPLLVASFAFNFNNFVIITLLTRGGPDFINSTVPAGHTDLLVSYTYRIAFQDSGQNFALAAAISMLIFLLVGIFALINLRLARVKV